MYTNTLQQIDEQLASLSVSETLHDVDGAASDDMVLTASSFVDDPNFIYTYQQELDAGQLSGLLEPQAFERLLSNNAIVALFKNAEPGLVFDYLEVESRLQKLEGFTAKSCQHLFDFFKVLRETHARYMTAQAMYTHMSLCLRVIDLYLGLDVHNNYNPLLSFAWSCRVEKWHEFLQSADHFSDSRPSIEQDMIAAKQYLEESHVAILTVKTESSIEAFLEQLNACLELKNEIAVLERIRKTGKISKMKRKAKDKSPDAMLKHQNEQAAKIAKRQAIKARNVRNPYQLGQSHRQLVPDTRIQDVQMVHQAYKQRYIDNYEINEAQTATTRPCLSTTDVPKNNLSAENLHLSVERLTIDGTRAIADDPLATLTLPPNFSFLGHSQNQN